MAANARLLAKPHAAQDIVDLIEGVALRGADSSGSTRE
jgi:hypothetical protein